jgi:murein DD-endopeptidase MepM/ murein hydrolase activator NlpD
LHWLTLARPHDGPVTQVYGNTQPDGLPHAGQDYGYSNPATGEAFPDVYAAGDGVILYAGDSRDLGWPNVYYLNPDFDRSDAQDSSAGNVVILGHRAPDGSIGAITGYGHLETILVESGEEVRAREIIGITGDTGFAFGKHLHFFLMFLPYVYGTPTYGCSDPNPYMVESLQLDYQSTITEQDNTMAALNDEEQRELLGNTRTLIAMLNNVAGAINDGKPIDEEAMLNARKIVERVIDGK